MANKDYIGKIIGVKIDRELGSKHPKHGFIYPVNYGFIPNTISGDGEEMLLSKFSDGLLADDFSWLLCLGWKAAKHGKSKV